MVARVQRQCWCQANMGSFVSAVRVTHGAAPCGNYHHQLTAASTWLPTEVYNDDAHLPLSCAA